MTISHLPTQPGFARLSLLVAPVLFPATALANNMPGPQTALGFVALLLAIPLITLAGGGATILERLKPKSKWAAMGLNLLKTLAVFAGFVMVSTVGSAGFTLIVLFAYAMFRAVRLLKWGVKAGAPEGERPAHLMGASRRRLVVAGCALVLAAVVLTHMSLSFMFYYPSESVVSRQLMQLGKVIKDAGENNTGADGLPRYRLPNVSRGGFYDVPEVNLYALQPVQGSSFGNRYVSDVALGADAKSFQAWAWPIHVPSWPWNHVMPVASFHIDQTGQLRMVRVSEAGRRCPPDAPVYMRTGG